MPGTPELWVAILLGAFVLLAVAPIGIGHALRRRAEQRLRAAVRGHLVLTFDDGPGAVLEPRLIDVLARHGAKATFFLLGSRAATMPERCDALRAAGHEIGSHGADHVNAWRCWPWRAIADVRRGLRQLGPWLGAPPVYRPPFGKLTLWSFWELLRHAALLGYWTHDSGDTMGEERPTPEHVVDRVLASGGGVVLLHSFDRRNADVADFVVRTTDALLTAAHERGLAVTTVSGLFRRG